MRNLIPICAVFLFASQAVLPQEAESPYDGFASNIGLKLEDLIVRFGAPKTVYTARGEEAWQDDVVFVYNDYDFYIYRDRVWQIGLKQGFGLKTGDAKAAVLSTLGDKARDEGDYLVCPVTGGIWPTALRVNFTAGKISGMFLYRTDF